MKSSMMDVVVCVEPGTLRTQQRPIPTHAADEVLIRVRHVGICGTDMHIFTGKQPYLTYPRVMGHELSGEVVAAPPHSNLREGDPVYVVPYMSCGICRACRRNKPNCCMNIEVLGVHCDGALAQFLAVPQRFVFRADGITLTQAAMIEFLAIGAHAMRRADVQSGQSVLVSGAGPIGIACALFSKLAGAEVTVVDRRVERLAFCRDAIGIPHTLSLHADMEADLSTATAGDMFDVVFDATGSPAAMQTGFRYVANGGAYVLVSVVSADITFSDPDFHRRETALLGSRNATPDDFEFVLGVMRSGRIPTEALNTHRGQLTDVPRILPQWMSPEAGVIKAIVDVG